MSDTEVLDKTFHFILKRMVDTGLAPHYTEIAAELGVSPEDGRKTMHTLFAGVYGWFFPNTDYIASFAPFNNQPTQDGISQLDGLLSMFSSNLFKRRMDPDYFSNMKKYWGELKGEVANNHKIGMFMKS